LTNRHENITSGVGVSTDDYDAVYPFHKRFNNLKTNLLKVDEEIFEVEKSIKKCEEKIDQASESITNSKGIMQKYWIKKEADLRKTKAYLRKKDAQLREEKADLRKEKAGLMVLLTKEAGMAVSTKPTGAKLCNIVLHICTEYNVTLNRYIDMVKHRYDIVLRYINCI
jgi:hypothetical protein